MVVLAATIGQLFTIPGQTMGFSVFTDSLIEELNLSRVTLSLAYCLGTVASGLTLPRVGLWLDRWGERRMTVVASMGTAAVLFYLGSVPKIQAGLVAAIPENYQSLGAFVMIGIGFYFIRLFAQGLLSMTCRNAIGKWFDIQRGLALAISGVLVSFGFSLAPRVLDWGAERWSHFGVWHILGIVTLIVMAPLAWALFRDFPEDSGLVMDGKVQRNHREKNPDMLIVKEFTLEEARRTLSFWAFNLTLSFYAFFATAFTFHIVSIGDSFGFDKTRILGLFLPIALASVVTNLLFGWINAKVRLKWLLLIMNLGGVLAVVGMLNLGRPWGVAAYVLGNGICSGGFVSLSGIVFPRFFGRRHLGAIGGVNMSSMVIASGLGPLVFGASMEFLSSYGPALLASIAIPVILGVLSIWADNPQRRLKAC